MVSKVNLKARINRHSRILKNNLWTIHPFRNFYYRWNYNVVLFLVIFLFPVYPLFSAFVSDTTQYSYAREDLDESSIIDSYVESDDKTDENINENTSSNEAVFENDGFLSINSIIDSEQRDLSNHTQVIDYEVKDGDSFSTIAYKFGVSKNTIYWANNFNTSKVLQPGDKIKIPPVSWVVHKIEKWDTLIAISNKYNVDQDKIITQNWLTIDSNLIAGKELIIPWAVKIIEKPVVTPVKSKVIANNKKAWKSVTLASGWSEWEYKLVKRAPARKFYWWNCTRYVAQYKNVDWNWNAKDWLRNAKANWYPTGSTATTWSIVVFHGPGYNPYYGHVWIVVNTSWSDLIIKDMNYRRLNEVTTRKVSKNDPAIIWYIYVD